MCSSYTVPRYDTYYMLLINCQYQPYRVGYNITGNLTIVNADGHELYAGAAPNVVVFRGFAVIWGIALGLWLCIRLKHDCTAHNARRIRYTHDLGKRLPHWSLTLIPLAQVISCALSCELWKRIDVVGTFPTLAHWDGPLSLSVSQNLFRTLAEVTSYGVLFVLSTGTRVSRRRMSCKIFLIGVLFIALLGVCSFLDQTYQFYSIGAVCTLSLLSWFCFFSLLLWSFGKQTIEWLLHFTVRLGVLALVYIRCFREVQQQESLGAFEARGVPYPNPSQPLYPVFERCRYFKSLREITVFWTICDITLYFVLVVVIEDWIWVIDFFAQVLYLITFIMLAFVFLPFSSSRSCFTLKTFCTASHSANANLLVLLPHARATVLVQTTIPQALFQCTTRGSKNA